MAAYLGKGKKEDLQFIAQEIGIKNVDKLNVLQLKKSITESEGYDEDFMKEFLNATIEERKTREQLELKEKKRKEEMEMEEKKRKEEMEMEEKKRKEDMEMEEKKRKEEMEEKKRKEEMEEKKRKEDMEFQLQKMRLENERYKIENGQGVELITAKPKLDLHSILQKFDPKSNDISLYLTLFERQVKRAEIKNELWVSYLIGLLPYDITQIIAREDEESTNDYNKVKELLLKRYKLTPERFRQLFTQHSKRNEITWSDYAYELKNYFQEWIRGLGIKTFEQLSDLIVTEQIKQKTPPILKQHFIDQWSQFTTPEDLITKLDDYENVRINFFEKQKDVVQREIPHFNRQHEGCFENEEGKNSRERKYTPPQYRDQNFKNFKKEEYSNTRNTETECYICGLSHFARECPKRYNKESDKHDIKQENGVLTATLRCELLENYEPRIIINPLRYVNILVDDRELNTLVDSGTQLPILNANYLPKQIETRGKIVLKSAIGERCNARLAKVQMSLKNQSNKNFSRPIEVFVAVCEEIEAELIIPPNIYNLLLDNSASIEKEMRSHPPDSHFPLQSKQLMEEKFSAAERCLCNNFNIGLDIDGINESKRESLKLREQQVKCARKGVKKKTFFGPGTFYSDRRTVIS